MYSIACLFQIALKMDAVENEIHFGSYDAGICEMEEHYGEQNDFDSESEREEMECALYSQIYFQQEIDNQSENNSYNINVVTDNKQCLGAQANSKTSKASYDSNGSQLCTLEPSKSVLECRVGKSRSSSPAGRDTKQSCSDRAKGCTKRSSLHEEDSDSCSSSDIEMAFDDGLLSADDSFRKNIKFNVKADQISLLSKQRSSKTGGSLYLSISLFVFMIQICIIVL